MHIANLAVGTPGHSWQSVAQNRCSFAKKGMLYAGKSVAATIMRLMDHPELIEQAKKEHFEKTGGHYSTILPKEVMPPIK
jgi:aminobenzoyl-glutamate utilization protein B